ncbi:MAG TPA: GtrA family protein [Bacillota bacterium]|nr:GtrA family protein [Bacillota bacterium]
MKIKKIIAFAKRIYDNSSFIRYFFVGGISWVVDALVLLAINRFTGGIIPDETTRLAVATYAGGVVGFIVNYILTLIMAFSTPENKRQGKSLKAFVIILIVSVAGWFLKEYLMQLGVNILKIGEDWLVNIPASAIVLFWNYLGRRFFVFTSKKPADTNAEDAELDKGAKR